MDINSKNGILKTFAVQSKNNDARSISTSGGTFFELADKLFLCNSGYVCAAGYGSDGFVRHKIVSKREELRDLQGSKYVQSRMGDEFNNVKLLLQNAKTVLFVGTPCQVSALKSYLGKEYDLLYTIDLICFGVPSPKVYNKWLEAVSKKYKKEISKVLFRDKSYGYAAPNVKIIFKDDSFIEQNFLVKSYMKTFMSGLNLRPSCSSCMFKGTTRVSDITLGDCWHIGNFNAKMDDNLGTTAAFIHTEKGLSMIKEIRSFIDIYEIDTNLEIQLDGKKMLYSTNSHSFQSEFYKDINTIPYLGVMKKWVPDSINDTMVSIVKRILKKSTIFKLLLKKARG